MSSPIADRVREAGIVGAGGAGFPTHVKFESKADTVIANGAECEPLLQCDKAVMRERTEKVLRGLSLLAEAASAERAVIALKGHYEDTVARVREVATRSFPDIEVFELGNYYPAGDEQVLVNEVTERVVPEGGIPIEVGVVVNNVITLSWVADAVDGSKPVTRRVLTVAGSVKRPITCEMPIGAPIGAAVELAGGATVDQWAIVEGGPMMGRVVEPSEPITKKTSGAIVLPTDHELVLRKRDSIEREVRIGRATCCNCRHCTDLCPRFNLGHSIQPHLIMRAIKAGGWGEVPPRHVAEAFLCCLCGVCEVYACPMALSPRRVYEQFRADLFAEGHTNPHRRKDCEPHDFQKMRRIPLPRLVARLGLLDYVAVPGAVDLRDPGVASVYIPLSQHTGAPSVPVVATGDRVQEGDLVAEVPEGKLGARQHASISGTVVQVNERGIQIEIR
jgi:Na+-translocating ferredoxin:NAD+ oxidoreductase RnfC subunit